MHGRCRLATFSLFDLIQSPRTARAGAACGCAMKHEARHSWGSRSLGLRRRWGMAEETGRWRRTPDEPSPGAPSWGKARRRRRGGAHRHRREARGHRKDARRHRGVQSGWPSLQGSSCSTALPERRARSFAQTGEASSRHLHTTRKVNR